MWISNSASRPRTRHRSRSTPICRSAPGAPSRTVARLGAPPALDLRRALALASLAVLALLAALLLAGCGGGGKVSDDGPQPTPDFRLASLEGGEISPADYEGKVVVIDFWATWCGPCRKQQEVLDEIYHQLDGDQVQFLAVDLGEDEGTVRDFIADNPFPYPVLMDPEDELTYELGIYGLPALMVVDTEGEVSYFEVGLLPKSQLLKEIRKAGAGTGSRSADTDRGAGGVESS